MQMYYIPQTAKHFKISAQPVQFSKHSAIKSITSERWTLLGRSDMKGKVKSSTINTHH